MNKSNIKIILRFLLPIVLGILIGIISKSLHSDIVIRSLLTISDNILVVLKIITPFLLLSMTASAFSKIKISKTKKFYFLFKFFMYTFITLLILGSIVFIISLIIVPLLSFTLVDTSTSFATSFYKLPLPKLFSKQYYSSFQLFMLSLGIFSGIFLSTKNKFILILNKLENIIYLIFKKLIIPIMPIWILATFSSTSFANAGGSFLATDFLLSIYILILQFTWLFIMYFITSKVFKINFKKMAKYGLQIYTYVVSIGGMGTQIVLPSIIKKEKDLGLDEQKSTIITATSFNMPGSLISNIVFVLGVVNIFNYDIKIITLYAFVFILVLATVVAPPIPGGTMAITSTLCSSMLGFSDEMVQIFSTMYYKQGIPNAATNNAADFYIAAPFKKEKN